MDPSSFHKKKLLKNLGIAGFLFFLAKGLFWIGLGIAAWLGMG